MKNDILTCSLIQAIFVFYSANIDTKSFRLFTNDVVVDMSPNMSKQLKYNFNQVSEQRTRKNNTVQQLHKSIYLMVTL
jgi:hypothetical protein